MILNFYLPQVRIPELFLPNIQELTARFEARVRSEPLQETPKGEEKELLGIIQDPEFRRNMSTVDLEMAVR